MGMTEKDKNLENKGSNQVKDSVIQGNYVALVTPFYDGKVDEKSFKRLIDFVIEKGCDGIVPCGTTGEAATLDFDEHIRVIELALEFSAGRVKVMAGTGSNSTQEAIQLTKKAEKLGVDSVLLIAPYYIRPTQLGLFEHYKRISSECEVKQVLYNIPSRTAVNIEAETVLKLAHECKNIVGIKEASGNIKQISEIIRDAPENFSVISGDDIMTLPILSLGGRGVISSTANIFPSEMTNLVKYCLEGDFHQARKIHMFLLEAFNTLFVETNPIPVKTALYLMGIIRSPELRLPLAPISQKNLDVLKNMLKKYGFLSE
jgi:4-hydroxy-tetrahydrodipicolinate synthase